MQLVLEVDEGTQHCKTGAASPHNGYRLVSMCHLPLSGNTKVPTLEEKETYQGQKELANVKHARTS